MLGAVLPRASLLFLLHLISHSNPTSMASFKYSPVPVIEQPLPSSKLSLDGTVHSPSLSEKGFHAGCQHFADEPHSCEEGGYAHPTSSNHRRCHNGRLHRFLLPAAIVSVVLLLLGCAMLAFNSSCLGYDSGMEGLVARALGSTTTSSGGTFTKNKLYLVVIFVGLLVVVILAIMLSAWCCKGAFKNPLCCPCYLCACCGGLACLECVGCGLCAEGLVDM